MASIQPQDPSGKNALTGALRLAPVFPDTPGGGELFRQEVEKAVDRQGGAKKLKERVEAESSQRSGERSAGFEKYNRDVGGARRSRRRGASREGESVDRTPGGGALVARPEVRDTRPASDSGRGGRDGGQRPEKSSTEVKPLSDRRPAAGGAGENAAQAGAVPGTSGASVGAGPSAAVAGSIQVSAPGAASGASNATQAFQAGAGVAEAETKLPKAPAAPAEAPARGAAPDLIEHASEVLRQIRLSLHGGSKEIRVQLTPESLGRIDIRLRSEDGGLRAVVRVEDPSTLKLLEHQAPELKALLAQQGFDADRISLDLGLAGGFTAPGDGGRGDREAGRAAAHRTGRIETVAHENNPTTTTPSRSLAAPGRVDTYA